MCGETMQCYRLPECARPLYSLRPLEIVWKTKLNQKHILGLLPLVSHQVGPAGQTY